MKKKGHPPYQDILFVDTATGHKFVIGSTLQPEETEEFEGKTYPVYRVPISSKSHPFFTGSQQFVDAEGRVDKFRKRYVNKKKLADQQAQKEQQKKEEALAAKKKTPAKKATEKKAEAKPAEKKAPAKKAAEKKAAPKKTEDKKAKETKPKKKPTKKSEEEKS